MPEIALNLDPFVKIRQLLKQDLVNIINVVSIAELSGISCFSLSITPENSFTRRNLELFRDLSESRLILRLTRDDFDLDGYIAYSPALVLLYNPASVFQHLDLEGMDNELKDLLESQIVEEIPMGIRIKPELEQLRRAYKLGFDYVELVCHEFSQEKTLTGRKLFLERLSNLIRICYKHDLGVILSGDLSFGDVGELAHLEQIEYIGVGSYLAGKSLLIGLREAINELLGTI